MKNQEKRESWERLVERFEREGGSRRAFCARHGLNDSTFRYWQQSIQDTRIGGEQGLLTCVEVARVPFGSGFEPSVSVETMMIRTAVPGSEVEVTVSGRLPLARLQRILDACGALDVSP